MGIAFNSRLRKCPGRINEWRPWASVCRNAGERIVGIYDIRAVADRHVKQNYASIVCTRRDRGTILDFGLIPDGTF